MPSLDDAKAKLDRAKEHFEAVDREIGTWTTSNPYRLTHQIQDNGHVHLWVLERTRPNEELPRHHVALLAGDCIHNLRCVLDYVAWQLAGANPNDRQTEFPICMSRKAFFGPTRGQSGIDKIHRLSRRAKTLVKWVQPYRRRNPDRDGLAILHALDINDKHKLLNVIAISPQGAQFAFINARPIIGPADVKFWVIPPSPSLKHGATFMGFRIEPPQPDMDVNAEFTADIVFSGGAANGLGVASALGSLIRQVESVLNLFERSWPKLI